MIWDTSKKSANNKWEKENLYAHSTQIPSIYNTFETSECIGSKSDAGTQLCCGFTDPPALESPPALQRLWETPTKSSSLTVQRAKMDSLMDTTDNHESSSMNSEPIACHTTSYSDCLDKWDIPLILKDRTANLLQNGSSLQARTTLRSATKHIVKAAKTKIQSNNSYVESHISHISQDHSIIPKSIQCAQESPTCPIGEMKSNLTHCPIMKITYPHADQLQKEQSKERKNAGFRPQMLQTKLCDMKKSPTAKLSTKLSYQIPKTNQQKLQQVFNQNHSDCLQTKHKWKKHRSR